jgi:membrane-bound metal-dependent hydrolase YbcI (DUF457 family)
MFIFAHIFAGAVFGLGLFHLIKDPRAVPFCIAGSVLPDLIDKPLGLLMPEVFGSGRTIFHSLGIVCIFLIIALIFVTSNHRVQGVGLVIAVFLHQVSDEMWSQPSNWFYPLFGPFQGPVIPDYISTFFWFEITNPGEWLLMLGTVLVLITAYRKTGLVPVSPVSDRENRLDTSVLLAFGGLGLYLVIAGFLSQAGTFLTPYYNPTTNVMAGLILLSGAIVMNW